MAKQAHKDNDGTNPLPDESGPAKRMKRVGSKNKWPSEKKPWNKKPPEDIESLLKWLSEYVPDMHLWGQRVRLDIIALEKGIGSGDPGDPGDPPAGPW